MKGLQTTTTHDGVRIVRLHYTADPAKDPTTRQGQAWLQRELVGYPGGQNDPRWRREMEIDFDAFGGQLLFPYLLEYQDAIMCDPIPAIPEHHDISAGFDYGTRNPSAMTLTAWNRLTGHPLTFWEYYETPQRKDEIDFEFRLRKGYRVLAQAIKDGPWWPEMQRRKTTITADASIWNKTQETKAGFKSIADLLAEEGVYLTKASRGKGSDMAWYQLISSKFWSNPKQPAWRITRNCTWLWKELQGLRFSEHSASAMETHNLRDEIVDKANHATDATKYDFLAHFAAIDKLIQDPNDWLDRRIDELQKPPVEDWEKALLVANSQYNQFESDAAALEARGMDHGDLIRLETYYRYHPEHGGLPSGRLISTTRED
jgi:hypothetical protein